MRWLCFAKILAFLLLPLMLLGTSFASSTISGRVTVQGPAAAAAPLPGAVIVASSKKYTQTAVADSSGNYFLTGLPVGTYTITYNSPGFLKGALSNYYLADGVTVAANAGLTPTLTVNRAKVNTSSSARTWDVSNPNPFAVTFTWTLKGGNVTGQQSAPPGSSSFTTLGGEESLKVYVNGFSMQPAATTLVVASNTGTLFGRVTDQNGTALAGVAVVANSQFGNPAGSATTAADSTYSIGNLPPDSYSVTYSVAGYQTSTQPVTTISGLTQLDAVLFPSTGAVSVQFLDKYSYLPVSGLSVTITDALGGQHGPYTSDQSGSISASNIPIGSATLAWSLDGFITDTAPIDIYWYYTPYYTQIVTPTVTPPGGIQVYVSYNSIRLPFSQVTVTDASNHNVGSGEAGSAFQLSGLQAGLYTVTVTSPGFLPYSASAEILPGQIAGVGANMTPARPVAIFGGVLFDPVNHIYLTGTVTAYDPDGNIVGKTIAPPPIGPFSQFFTIVAPVGMVVKFVYESPGYLAASRSFDFTAYQPNNTYVDYSAPLIPISSAANLTVTVIDAASNTPVPNARVSCSAGSLNTGPTGMVTFTGLLAGQQSTVTAQTLSGNQYVGYVGQTFPNGFVAGDNQVTLIIPAGSVQGTVTQAGPGTLLGGVQVVLRDANGAIVGSTVSQLNGYFLIPSLTPGIYTVTYTLANYSDQVVSGVVVISGGVATANGSLVPLP
jgi:hypothetical protein